MEIQDGYHFPTYLEMREDIVGTDYNFFVAGLNLRYKLHFDPGKLVFPPGYGKFLTKPTAEAPRASAVLNELQLEVQDLTVHDDVEKTDPICITEIWELWNNSKGEFTFIGPRNKPPVTFEINQEFSEGIVYGDFSGKGQPDTYAFEGIDIVIFANWLTKFSDVILHAAGIAVDGKGYAFVGPSGVGKSTLTEPLAKKPGVSVLGEDQVVLRYLDEQFWIFGTPWHERPELCSPLGVPLEKIFLLNRDNGQKLSSVNPIEGVVRTMQTAFIPYYRQDRLPSILERLSLLSAQVPFYNLAYQLGSDVLPIILSA